MTTIEFYNLIHHRKHFLYDGKHRFYRASESEWCLISNGSIIKVYTFQELKSKLIINKITL